MSGPAIPEDRQLLWVMIAAAILVLVGAVLLAVLPISYPMVCYALGIYAVILLLVPVTWRLTRRHYSLGGYFWMLFSTLTWGLWNQLLWFASVLSGWARSGQPPYHLILTVAVGLAPLLFGIWKLGARLRSAR